MVEKYANREIMLAKMDPEYVRQEIGDYVIDFCKTLGKSGMVIGLSGGVDSTVSAGIISSRFAEYNKTIAGKNHPLEIIGYALPSNTNNPDDLKDGVDVAKRLGIEYRIMDIEDTTNSIIAKDNRIGDNLFVKGNMMSEIRAVYLHVQAALEGKLVAGTGNKDEDFGIGYYTLFGDGAVHISPIGGLSKRLVREMVSYLGFDDIAKRIPTAGLEPGQTDFKDLGYSYDLVEILGCGIEQGFSREEMIADKAVNSIALKDRLDYATLFGASKFDTTEKMVDDMLRRHKTAIHKADLISPKIVPITLDYVPASQILRQG